jgi:hypothetical protein
MGHVLVSYSHRTMDEITSLLIADMIDEEEEDENEMMVL